MSAFSSVSCALLLLSLAVLIVAPPPPKVPPPNQRGAPSKPPPGASPPEGKDKLPDRKTYRTFFEALVEPVEPEAVVIPLDDETEMQFVAATNAIQKWVQDKISLEGLAMKSEEDQKMWEEKAAINKAKSVNMFVNAIKKGSTFQEAHIGMAIAQFKALPEGAQKDAMEKAKEKVKSRPAGRKERTREHASEANHMEKMQLEQMTTDEERKAWVEDVMSNGPPHAKKMREEKKKGGASYQQFDAGGGAREPLVK